MSADTLAERIRELTTKAGKFLTSEHRRKYDHGKECLACSGIAVPVPTEEDMAAFALSELSAAEQVAKKEERERCATLADEITIYTNDDCSRVRNRIVTAIRNRE